MKEKRNNLIDIERSKNASMNMGLKSPQFKIQQMGSALEIVLVTGMDCQFMFNETIRVLQEEGSDIVNASYTVVENAVFHTIHCQVRHKFPVCPLPYEIICNLIVCIFQVGGSANGALRISEKIKKYLNGC